MNTRGDTVFFRIAATLTGEPIDESQSPVAEGADRLRVVAAILRAYGGPDALRVADAIETWLYEGGDLCELLGIKVARGHSHELPHRVHAKRRREQRIALEVERLRQRAPGITDADLARLLVLTLRDPARLAVLREIGEPTAYPTSQKALRLIVRELRR